MAFDYRGFDSQYFETLEPFDIRALTDTVRDALRDRLYPRQLSGTIEIALSDGTNNIQVGQQFIPFSTVYRTDQKSFTVTFKAKKTGNPTSGLVLSLVTDDDDTPSSSTLGTSTIPVGSIPASLDLVTTPITLSTYLGSKTKYWLKFSHTLPASTVNYLSLGRSDSEEDYWMGLSGSSSDASSWSILPSHLYFDCSIPNFIYGEFPRSDLSLYSYPRVAVAIAGRPTVTERWIDHRIADYEIQLTVVVYSRYPDETDDLISFVDRVIWEKRIDLPNIRIATPGMLTPLTPLLEGKYTRTALYFLTYRAWKN